MLHPPMTHFAIVLPVVALVFGLLYLFRRSEMMSKVSTRITVFAALFIGLAWYTGAQEGPDVYIFLSEEGQALLKAHKHYAPYLFFAVAAAALLKLFGCLKKNVAVEAVAVLLLLLSVGGILYQGNLGGKLVYEYGAGVEDYSDGMDCLEEQEEEEENE